MTRLLSASAAITLLIGATTVGAAERPADSARQADGIPAETLAEMGLAGMPVVSDAEGLQVRGRLFGGFQLLRADQLSVSVFQLAKSETLRFTEDVEFVVHLQDFKQQLGPEFSGIDLSAVELKVKKTIQFSRDANFAVSDTLLTGTGVEFIRFDAPLRVTGGVWP